MPRETSSISDVYDPKTGTWKPASPTVGSDSSSSQSPDDIPNSATGGESSETNSKTEADKEYIETEFNTLTGELVVVPSKKTLRIEVKNTIELLGVGRYLSGKYFVSAVKRTISKDGGYAHTLTVLKNGFGDSLKSSMSSADDTESRAELVEKSAPTFKVGDVVKIVGEAIYNTGIPVPAWVKDKTLKVQQISSDGTRVLLAPVYKWTYVRFIQKV